MRRYAFYLAVALLAFGVGSFIVNNFYWKFSKESKILETHTQKNSGKEYLNQKSFDSQLTNEQADIIFYNPVLKEPTCSDKNLLPVWNELLKDKEFQESSKRFYHEADCSVMLHIQKTDLNDDGEKEIILSGNNSNLCDAAFSCFYWIFEKKDNKYKQLLRSKATGYNEIANFTVKRGIEISKTKVNGYRTIILRGGPGYQTFQFTFQFEKDKYKEKECLTFENIINKEEPLVRTCKDAWKK